MRRYNAWILILIITVLLAGCGKKEKHEIEILIPTGSTEAFVYSETEICPVGNKVTIWSGAGLGDTEVILKPVDEKVETGYVGEYLTHGVPVEFDTRNVKDEWFKIGVAVQNDSDGGPIAVSVEVEGVEVRMVETSSGALDVSNKDLMLLSDSFWESVTKIVFYDFTEEIYETLITEELEAIKEIFAHISYKEIENPEIEGWYMFELQTKDNSYHLRITGKTIKFNGKFYKVSESIANELISILKKERVNAEEKLGITLIVENISSTNATIKCMQSGGEPTGELHTGSWYILESWTQENGWMEMPYIRDYEIGWTQEAWMIPMEDTTEWEINWKWLYGSLPEGKYRIGKEITDFRATGDYDNAVYFVEFEIVK
ncbi:MAG: hypothetical protein IKW30_13020 [Lachnospiraceae bacterium]|nr:hypothetical protein [Lachnospiraceae bacterium]